MLIKEVSARAIYDSRGEKTIEVTVNGQSASSPSGKSTGKYETPCYHKSLAWNISAINKLKDIIGMKIDSFDDLRKIESAIKRKFKFRNATQFGANALFALESAILKALAKANKKELWQVVNLSAKRIPVPAGNIIGGGLHSHNDNHPTFQEFLIIPQAGNAKDNFALMKKYHAFMGAFLNSKKKNDEGAWQTELDDMSILHTLSRLEKVKIGIDAAASSFHCKGKYEYIGKELDRTSQIHYMNELIRRYGIFYTEDPLEEEDFKGFAAVNKSHLIVGDDLTATHISRVKKAVKMKSMNAMIVKPNQNGSLLQLKEIISFCKKNKIKIIISHRSGETMDNALADYAVAFGADYIKCGIATKWREAKLNRLVEIESQIKGSQ